MTSEAELPPLTPAQTREVLRQLGDLTENLVLVGGQALAFWAERYASRFTIPGPVNSKDIDFGEMKDVVAIAAARLGGTWKVPEPFANTPNSGLVEFKDPGGHERRIDFLAMIFGLDLKEVFEMAIGVEVPDPTGVTTFQVMHPVHCLEARIANVGGLPGYETRLALDQGRAAVLCAKEYLRDRLDDGKVRVVLRLNERIYRYSRYNHYARLVFLKYGIDAFEAVLVDDRLPEPFRKLRYPQMRATMDRLHARWRANAERASARS